MNHSKTQSSIFYQEKWTRNEDIIFPQASVIKIPVLAALYRQAEAEILSLDDKVERNMDEKVEGSGVLQYLSTKLKIRNGFFTCKNILFLYLIINLKPKKGDLR